MVGSEGRPDFFISRAGADKEAAQFIAGIIREAGLTPLRPWLNGPSDGGFWAALGAVALLALVAAGAAVGRRRVVG